MGVLGLEVVGYDSGWRIGMDWDIVGCGVEWRWVCEFVDQRLVEPVALSVWHGLKKYVVYGGIPDNKACM